MKRTLGLILECAMDKFLYYLWLTVTYNSMQIHILITSAHQEKTNEI